MSFHFLIFLYFSRVFWEHLRGCSPCAICFSVSWQSQLASCCLLSSLVSSRLLSPVSLPLISRSCPVVRHLSFALSSPAPSRCFILIAPSACPLPPFFFLLPFFSSPQNSNFDDEQLSTTELSRTGNRAKRFSCYVTRLVIYLHVIASVAPESLHFIFIFFFHDNNS